VLNGKFRLGWVFRCCVNVSLMNVETLVENIIESCFKWIAKDMSYVGVLIASWSSF
jgi:hypothetical protein